MNGFFLSAPNLPGLDAALLLLHVGIALVSRTKICTGQSLSENGVFAPSMRQPVQFIISGRIVTPLSFVHRATVFSRKALSFVSVAILASHFSQSSPQQPISWFLFFIVSSIKFEIKVVFLCNSAVCRCTDILRA